MGEENKETPAGYEPIATKDETSIKLNGADSGGDATNHHTESSTDHEAQSPKLEGQKSPDDDEDDPKEDVFLFGMTKIRTFFFFLSIALLVAFVLVFIFVLPCSEQPISDGSAARNGSIDSSATEAPAAVVTAAQTTAPQPAAPVDNTVQ